MTRIRTDRQPYQKTGKVVDSKFRAQWAKAHNCCQVCGGSICSNIDLTTHHIVGGAMRSDEATNFIRAGWSPCHMQMEGIRQRCGSKKYDPIPLEEQFEIKRKADPEEFDQDRLFQLLGRKL